MLLRLNFSSLEVTAKSGQSDSTLYNCQSREEDCGSFRTPEKRDVKRQVQHRGKKTCRTLYATNVTFRPSFNLFLCAASVLSLLRFRCSAPLQHTHTHERAHTHTHTHTHARARTHTHTHTHIRLPRVLSQPRYTYASTYDGHTSRDCAFGSIRRPELTLCGFVRVGCCVFFFFFIVVLVQLDGAANRL